ncbi:MAG: GLUG motif-containing protein, partial [Rikenellaceae bacterium]
MKKYIIYLAALFAFAGCQNDIEELNITLPSQHSLTVSLPTVDDSTRIEFADGESSISLNWEQGDTFTIYDSSGSKVDDYECSASSDSSSAIFTALSGVNQLLDGDSYTAIFPAVEDVITLDDHRTALAARISEQTQVGNNSTNHLNDALRMEAQFTYSGDSATQVTFAHTLATMRITFALEGGAIPTAFEFYDGDYESYTINMNDISTSNSYTAYYVINPNEGGERTLIFIITTATAEMQLFSVISSVTYSVGQSYVASVPGLTTVEIPDDYTPIYSVLDLNNVRNNLSGNYILMNDLNLSSYDNWAPIGSSEESSFSGIFDGGGHTVTGLTINSTDYYQGLFGYVNCGSISNLIIKDAQVIGDCYVGAVCGWLYGGTIAACSVEGGSVSASNSVGGVVGCAYNNSSITNCYNIGSVSGE